MEQRGTAKAVKSILNQTLTDFEFIIYDDGSDPEVAGYIRELESLNERNCPDWKRGRITVWLFP